MDLDRCTEAEQGRIRDERDAGSADFPTNSQGENDDFSKTAVFRIGKTVGKHRSFQNIMNSIFYSIF